MKLNQAKKFYKKSQNDGLENTNPYEIFKKINYELVKALQIVSQKIDKKEIDGVRQKNFTKALTIIYTLQTNLNFEKELKLSTDLFKFYEFCRKKLIEGITSLKSKEIFKSAVNLDRMFDFNYIQMNGPNNAIR
jgi:flagellar protein FliS